VFSLVFFTVISLDLLLFLAKMQNKLSFASSSFFLSLFFSLSFFFFIILGMVSAAVVAKTLGKIEFPVLVHVDGGG